MRHAFLPAAKQMSGVVRATIIRRHRRAERKLAAFASAAAGALAVLLSSFGPAEGQGKPVEQPYTLDIASVRLGMSAKDAIAAIKQHFHASDKQLTILRGGSALRPGKDFVAGVIYREDGFEVLDVGFAERVPPEDARPEYGRAIG